MRELRRQSRGFTFLEIVFAVAILACAMVPIMTSMQFGTRRTGFNIKRITATMIANSYMERDSHGETDLSSGHRVSGRH